MDGGLLQVTWAGTSEPGWQLCVTSDSGHSKFRVLREPGLSDSESGHGISVTWGLGPLRVMEGRCGYFWKENFAKFARKPLKQCKICSSATRDTCNLGCCMALPA